MRPPETTGARRLGKEKRNDYFAGRRGARCLGPAGALRRSKARAASAAPPAHCTGAGCKALEKARGCETK
jgi:hypothetical protein